MDNPSQQTFSTVTTSHETEIEIDLTVPEPSQSLSKPALLWREKGAILLLLITRIAEFTGNTILVAALSNETNADAVSAALTYDAALRIIFGALIMGTQRDFSEKRTHLISTTNEDDKIKNSIIHCCLSGLLIASLSTTLSWPLYRESRPILALSISEQSTLDHSEDLLTTLFSNATTLTFHLNWLIQSILVAFNLDKTLAFTQITRLMFIIFAAKFWIEQQNELDDQFHTYSIAFLIGNIIPIIIGIFTLLAMNNMDETYLSFPKSISCTNIKRDLSPTKTNLKYFLTTISNQLKVGISFLTSFAPALLMEHFLVSWVAPKISIEAIESMRGFIEPKVILILSGNAMMILVLRLGTEAYANINGSSSDRDIALAKKYFFDIEAAFRNFNIVIGVLGTATVIGMTKYLQDQFDPDNDFLGRPDLQLLSMLGGFIQILNDTQEGALAAVNLLRFKLISTPISFAAAVFFARAFVAANGKMHGLFSGVALAMLINTFLLILYTYDRLPRFKANIGQIFNERKSSVTLFSSADAIADESISKTEPSKNNDNRTGARLTWV